MNNAQVKTEPMETDSAAPAAVAAAQDDPGSSGSGDAGADNSASLDSTNSAPMQVRTNGPKDQLDSDEEEGEIV